MTFERSTVAWHADDRCLSSTRRMMSVSMITTGHALDGDLSPCTQVVAGIVATTGEPMATLVEHVPITQRGDAMYRSCACPVPVTCMNIIGRDRCHLRA
jgi:hypothetical protein